MFVRERQGVLSWCGHERRGGTSFSNELILTRTRDSFTEPRVWGEDGRWLKGGAVNGGGPGRAAPAMSSWPQ